MEILIYKDLIINFVSQRLKNKDQQKLISKIFSNDDSVFVYSKKFFQFIKDELGDDFTDEINALITKLSDNRSNNIKSSDNSQNFDEEFLHIYRTHNKNVLVPISYSQLSELVSNQIHNFAIISEIQKPNFHWLVTQLAVLHPNKVTVKYSDFATNAEVNDFFNNVFRIPKLISKMAIFDRESNTFNHGKFDSFRNTASVFYYTLNHPSFQSIRGSFKKVSILTIGNPHRLHQRKLVFEGFVLTSNHSFSELLVGGDWEIDILYCHSEALQWISRCNDFRRV